MSKKMKEKIDNSLVVQCWKEDLWLKILTITAIVLLVTAFFIPPMAVIDGSILAAVGEISGLGAIWEFNKAVNKNIDAKVKIKEIELELNNDEKQDKEEDDRAYEDSE